MFDGLDRVGFADAFGIRGPGSEWGDGLRGVPDADVDRPTARREGRVPPDRSPPGRGAPLPPAPAREPARPVRTGPPAKGAEAILDARRRVVHAVGPAKSKAIRQALVTASKARDPLANTTDDERPARAPALEPADRRALDAGRQFRAQRRALRRRPREPGGRARSDTVDGARATGRRAAGASRIDEGNRIHARDLRYDRAGLAGTLGDEAGRALARGAAGSPRSRGAPPENPPPFTDIDKRFCRCCSTVTNLPSTTSRREGFMLAIRGFKSALVVGGLFSIRACADREAREPAGEERRSALTVGSFVERANLIRVRRRDQQRAVSDRDQRRHDCRLRAPAPTPVPNCAGRRGVRVRQAARRLERNDDRAGAAGSLRR